MTNRGYLPSQTGEDSLIARKHRAQHDVLHPGLAPPPTALRLSDHNHTSKNTHTLSRDPLKLQLFLPQIVAKDNLSSIQDQSQMLPQQHPFIETPVAFIH